MEHSPIGPAPMTSTRVPGSTPDRLMPWRATASGSTRQACSTGRSVGSTLAQDGIHPHLVGQPAVEADPVHRAEGGGTLLLGAGQAALAAAAAHDGQDATGVPSSSRPENSWPRVTADGPNGDQVEVGPTDPRTGHRYPDATGRPGSRWSTTRIPSSVHRTPRIGPTSSDRGPFGDGQDVGVGADDPRDVLGHELVLIGLGLVGGEGLLGLPALEEAEPARLLEILGPPVVDAAPILPAPGGHRLQGGDGLLPLVGWEIEKAGQCMQEIPQSICSRSAG